MRRPLPAALPAVFLAGLVACSSAPPPTVPPTPPLWAREGSGAPQPGDPPPWIIDGRGDLVGRGKVCVDGWIRLGGHVLPRDEGGPLLRGACDLELLENDPGAPSGMFFTEPPYYPGATYYFVSYVNTVPPYFRVSDAAGNSLDLGTGLEDLVVKRRGRITLAFRGGDLSTYFDPVLGVFRPVGVDSAVVVNFAEVLWGGVTIPTPGGYLDLEFDARPGDLPLNVTVINAHHRGPGDVTSRRHPASWEGGRITVGRALRWEPTQGLAMITKELAWTQAGVDLGTETRPALAAVQGHVRGEGRVTIHGSLVFLGDLDVGNRLAATYDPRLGALLPPYLGYVVFGD